MAYDFEAGNAADRIDFFVPANFTPDVGGITVSFWAWRESSSTTHKRFIDVRDASANFSWQLQWDNGAADLLQISFGPSASSTYRTFDDATLSQWQHYLVTWTGARDQTTILLYIDGVAASVSSGQDGSGAALSTDGEWVFGNRPTGPDYWLDGKLAEFAVWDRVLTTVERGTLEHFAPEVVPDHVFYAPFRDNDRTSKGIAPHTSTALRTSEHPPVQRPGPTLYMASGPTAAAVGPDYKSWMYRLHRRRRRNHNLIR